MSVKLPCVVSWHTDGTSARRGVQSCRIFRQVRSSVIASIRERVKLDGSRAFHAQVRINGFPSRTASFATKRRAVRWATTVEAEMIEGRHFRNPESRRRTVADAIDRYLLEEIPKKKNGSLHKATLPWWRKQIGTVRLSEVTPDLIVRHRTELAAGQYTRSKPTSKRTSLKQGQLQSYYPRQGSTVNRYLACLSHVFSVARKEWRWIGGNPISDVSKLREGKPRDKVLSAVERKLLLNETAKNPMLHAFVVVSLSTAARAGELIKLTCGDVDIATGQVIIREPKNGEMRTLWLHSEARRLVGALAQIPHQQDDRVFVNESKRGWYQYSKLFNAATDAAGIEGFTFHGLRHTAATYLAQQGATEQQLRAIGGWKSNVVSRYIHLAANDTKATVEKMNTGIFDVEPSIR
jgi:integrase